MSNLLVLDNAAGKILYNSTICDRGLKTILTALACRRSKREGMQLVFQLPYSESVDILTAIIINADVEIGYQAIDIYRQLCPNSCLTIILNISSVLPTMPNLGDDSLMKSEQKIVNVSVDADFSIKTPDRKLHPNDFKTESSEKTLDKATEVCLICGHICRRKLI